MPEARWVPVSVDPLVPPARLGALLVQRRTATGLDLVAMAQRSNGMFTPTFLENAERGRVPLDERIISHLVGLYEVNTGPVLPQRHELVLDLDHQQMKVGDTALAFDSLHTEHVLNRYVSLIYMLRGLKPGADLVLRDRDLDVLSSSLGRSELELRTDIRRLIEAPDSVQRAKQVSKGKIIAAAGLLVGITAVGTLVLVGGTTSQPATEVLGAQQTLVTGTVVTGSVSDLGAQAEATIDYDFRGALSGWQINYADGHPDFLGVTRSAEKAINVHISPTSTVDKVASVLMHEVGHAIDLERLTDADRAHWIEMRGMPPTWWPGNGLSDFAVGAGDFAEAVAVATTGSQSNSVYGDYTAEQLDFVRSILNTN